MEDKYGKLIAQPQFGLVSDYVPLIYVSKLRQHSMFMSAIKSDKLFVPSLLNDVKYTNKRA